MIGICEHLEEIVKEIDRMIKSRSESTKMAIPERPSWQPMNVKDLARWRKKIKARKVPLDFFKGPLQVRTIRLRHGANSAFISSRTSKNQQGRYICHAYA